MFDSIFGMILVCVIVLIVFSLLVFIIKRYKKCPSDRVMVIYGKVGSNKDGTTRSAKCIHGGAAFIWPVIQAYEFLDLTPMSISVDLENALSRQNIRINVPSRFTVGVSTEPGVMQNAAERLLGLKLQEIQELAKDIIFGQLRLVIATMDIEEINTDRDKFLEAVSRNVEGELKKIGLRLINVNVTDISDESGYIDALGKEAAAKAINDAKKNVAERDRDGSIGEANARKDQRVQVAQADATAIQGENAAKVEVAMSNAQRREKEAEATRIATAAEKIAAAQALEEAYAAEQKAEEARAQREKATQEADVIVRTEIDKRRMELEAEAEAEQIRRKARGEADAILNYIPTPTGLECPSILLHKNHQCVITSMDHPLASRGSVQMEELRDEPFVVMARTASVPGHDFIWKTAADAGFAPRVVAEATHVPLLLTLVSCGVGISTLSDDMACLAQGKVAFIPLLGIPFANVRLMWNEDNQNPALPHLLDVFRSIC